MAMQFSIVYGPPATPTTIDCQANGYTLLDGYYPDTASDPGKPVTDNARLEIKASSPSDLSDKIGALNLAFEHARTHKAGPLGCYLKFAPDASSSLYRTRIANGITILDGGLSRRWKQNKAILGLALERAPWWEGPETQVPLSNSNGSNNTTGLTVYNHDDAGTGHDNYVQIDNNDVLGDLPGATRLELVNDYATNRLYDVWIGRNHTDIALAHILEAENAAGGSSGSDATCSGGSYRYISLISGADMNLFTWALDAYFLAPCRGRFFKILARFWDGNAPFLNNIHHIQFKLKIVYQVTTLWETGWATIDPARSILIRDLATLRIPPWLPEQIGLNAVDLVLMARQDTGTTYTAGLDFLQVTPVDGWRYLTCAGYGVAQNQRILDDGINGDVYIDNGSGANKLGLIVPYGSPLLLKPHTLQRLYFLMHSHLANTAEIARTLSVKLFYRPRKQNL